MVSKYHQFKLESLPPKVQGLVTLSGDSTLFVFENTFIVVWIIKYIQCLLQKYSNAEMYKTSNSPEVSTKSRYTCFQTLFSA